MLKETKTSLIAKLIGEAPVTINKWIKGKKEDRYKAEALKIGAMLLENGFTFPEVRFLAEYRFKPERKELLDIIEELKERISVLEDGLLDIGIICENGKDTETAIGESG